MNGTELTPYANPTTQPWDYHGQMGDAFHEASANYGESYVYTATDMLRGYLPTAHKVVFERKKNAQTHTWELEFARIEDAEGTEISNPAKLAELVGDSGEDEHGAVIALHHLYAAYGYWQSGATRRDERAWRVDSTYDWQGDGPQWATFTLPPLSVEEKTFQPGGLIRVHRFGFGSARIYDAGSTYSGARSTVRLRHVLNVAKTTISLTGDADEPGQTLAIELDPAVTQITINGTIINL